MVEWKKGGVIMDVINAEQAKIAEAAGAVAVMALERVRRLFQNWTSKNWKTFNDRFTDVHHFNCFNTN